MQFMRQSLVLIIILNVTSILQNGSARFLVMHTIKRNQNMGNASSCLKKNEIKQPIPFVAETFTLTNSALLFSSIECTLYGTILSQYILYIVAVACNS